LSITRDGKRLLVQLEELPKFDLGVLELGPPATLTRLTRSGTEGEGTLSPDGQWVAYQSKASTDRYAGRVIVRPFPDVERGLWVVSTGVGQAPIWSRDGRQIFYRTEDGTVMSVPITTAPAFRHGTPIPVVASPVNTIREGLTYAVSPDGQRFLFIRTPELDIRSLKVILNWDVEVKAMLAGTGAAPR
jgi:Tol biopolymer transport system component